MSDTPTDRKYLVSHEWHKVEGDVCTIGITSIAAEELTDITYVDLPEAGTQVTKGQTFGEIESVKATSDLYAGVSGEVIEVNAALSDDPSLVNNDPHGGGWMLKVKMSNPADTDDLLDNAAYLKETGHA